MIRRLVLILALTLVPFAAAANPICPDPFPFLGLAPDFLTFDLHGHIHTITLSDASTFAGHPYVTHRFTFTTAGYLQEANEYDVNGKILIHYHATFNPLGLPATATLDSAFPIAKYVWHYVNGASNDYIDLYTVSLDDPSALPASPTYRIVPNVSSFDYVVYRKDGSVAAALYYHQGQRCSLTAYRLDIASPTQEIPLDTALTGQFLAYHSRDTISLNTVSGGQPGLVVSIEGAQPTSDYSQYDAKRALAKDALGNVTRYVSGHPTPHFNGWQLNPDASYSTTKVAYSYY